MLYSFLVENMASEKSNDLNNAAVTVNAIEDKLMGFHKRWLMNDSLIEMYRNRGINAIAEWVDGADALMAEEGLASQVLDLLYEEKFRPTETWNKISMLISEESIKQGF